MSYCLCRRMVCLLRTTPFAKEHDELALGICQTLVGSYRLMDSNLVHFPDGAKNCVSGCRRRIGRIVWPYSQTLFRPKHAHVETLPKAAQLHAHMPGAIMMWNPKYGWCYGDDDLSKYMIGIWYSVHARTLAVSVLTK